MISNYSLLNVILATEIDDGTTSFLLDERVFQKRSEIISVISFGWEVNNIIFSRGRGMWVEGWLAYGVIRPRTKSQHQLENFRAQSSFVEMDGLMTFRLPAD